MGVETARTLGSRAGDTTAEVSDFLAAHGLVAEGVPLEFTPLNGGVSSDIWLVSGGGRQVAVKRPLTDLKVGGGWRAPLSRSHSEAAWLRTVGDLLPGMCPRVLAFDGARNLLALEYLEPTAYAVWKSLLLDGHVDVTVAVAVGDRLGYIHQRTAAQPSLARQFATDDLFRSLRIEPYLEHVARRHPSLAAALGELAETTSGTKRAVVHGDVSPKNILVGRHGPVILDAECAWWGDPAFDLAFCLNHLLLKCLLPRVPSQELLEAFDELVAAYVIHIDWEDANAVTERAAHLLPALMLARVDGRSPVEYLGPEERDLVRGFTMPLLLEPTDDLSSLRDQWERAAA